MHLNEKYQHQKKYYLLVPHVNKETFEFITEMFL